MYSRERQLSKPVPLYLLTIFYTNYYVLQLLYLQLSYFKKWYWAKTENTVLHHIVIINNLLSELSLLSECSHLSYID